MKRIVKDILAESPDAEFILEPDEYDLQWTMVDFSLDSLNFKAPKERDKELQTRVSDIERWAASVGGIKAAMKESPPLLLDHAGRKLELLDGWHRIYVAKKHQLKTIDVLVGYKP